MENKYIRGEVVLENGMRSDFYLGEDDIAVLEKGVQIMRKHCEDGIKENTEYTIADELTCMIIPRCLDILKDRMEIETLAGRQPGNH